MLHIPCPYCGRRAEIEFRYGGPGKLLRPGPPDTVSDQEWAEYLFIRTNPKGLHSERWLHAAGCGRWFNLTRDTKTHEILNSSTLGAHVPADTTS